MGELPSSDNEFRCFYTEHRSSVWTYCARRLPPDEVMDAVADVFLVVWRRADDVPEGDAARLWMYGIARNVVRNRRRSAHRRRRLTERLKANHNSEFAPVHTSGSELDPAVRAALGQLSGRDRELVLLRAWEDLTLADIAAVTGLSVRAVESRLARARKKLASLLADHTSNQMRLSPTRPEGGGP